MIQHAPCVNVVQAPHIVVVHTIYLQQMKKLSFKFGLSRLHECGDECGDDEREVIHDLVHMRFACDCSNLNTMGVHGVLAVLATSLLVCMETAGRSSSSN